MASDFEAFTTELLQRFADAHAMPYEMFVEQRLAVATTLDMSAWQVWYRGVEGQLHDAPAEAVIQLPMVWTTGFPARFVWVDRHLRVWRLDDDGRVSTSASLAG